MKNAFREPPPSSDPIEQLDRRVARLEIIVTDAALAASNLAKLSGELRRSARAFEPIASGLAGAASHLEDVLSRLNSKEQPAPECPAAAPRSEPGPIRPE
jgi:hypothetical protein